MQFTLPDLPYQYQVLEPYVDKETMVLHHTKHHQTYVTKLNEALSKQGADETMDLTTLQCNMAQFPTAVRNNGMRMSSD